MESSFPAHVVFLQFYLFPRFQTQGVTCRTIGENQCLGDEDMKWRNDGSETVSEPISPGIFLQMSPPSMCSFSMEKSREWRKYHPVKYGMLWNRIVSSNRPTGCRSADTWKSCPSSFKNVLISVVSIISFSSEKVTLCTVT